MPKTFLFCSALAAIGLSALWLVYWPGLFAPPGIIDGALWHGHEMLFAFLVPLALGLYGARPHRALLALWLAGRIALLVSNGPLVSVIDLLFLPATAVFVPKARRTPVFFLALALLFAADLMVHANRLGMWDGAGRRGLYLGLDTLLVLAVIACRELLPQAAGSELPGYRNRVRPYLDWLAVITTVLFAVADVTVPFSDLTTALAIAAALAHFARFWHWRDDRIWQQPFLWILFTGYLWLVVGFILRVYANLFAFPVDVIAHAFSAGSLSVLGFGAAARLSRKRFLVAGFWGINFGALAKVFAPIYLAYRYDTIVEVSGVIWTLSLAVLAAACWPAPSAAPAGNSP